ncbi:AraC family transcriptional regulator [Bosea sp. TWI1241]|uniref:helix-turn-helix transcriptional regulator n=1 Tax=Bosea sp. TWI1241 TaxID=3148904 RepID=UPI00320B7DA1
MPLPPAADRPVPGTLGLFSNHLSLAAGRFASREGERVVGPMRTGLKIAVLLDCRQTLALDDRPPVVIEGPSVLVAASHGQHLQRRTSLADGTQASVLMQFDIDFLAREFGPALDRLMAGTQPGEAALWLRPAGPATRRLAAQMAEGGVSPAGPFQRLHLAGQALELCALALGEVIPPERPRSQRLDPRTREQIHAVRDMLLAATQAPPSLAELARASGLNPSKLTAAFRREFGTSVFGYLQEHRLQQAYAMIASGEASVSVAAFSVGYSPAHFSSLFRKRFGLPPSALRA